MERFSFVFMVAGLGFFALAFTAQASHMGTDSRGISNYPLAKPQSGAGIRTR